MAVSNGLSFGRPSYILALTIMAVLSLTSCGKKDSSVMSPVAPIISQRPFGAHLFSYAVGTIKPSSVTQTQLDQSTTNFYDQWKATYLRAGCGPGRYYIWTADSAGGGKAPGSVSVSEGHGYGMIIAALMAGYDPSAKAYFDGMFRYFKDHPAVSSSNLMAWNQLADCTNSPAPYGGSGTATDGDLDIAYALVLADRQWGSATGPINYLQEAKNVIQAALAVEVNATSKAIFLGDFVDLTQPNFYNGTRPSDFMPDHFRTFQSVTGDANWNGVVNKVYSVINTIQTNNSPATGLIPDFVINANTTPQPAGPNYLETAYDGEFSYNACRVPLRLATDYLVSGEPRALTAVQKINSWIKGKVGSNAALVVDGYTLAGANSAGAIGAAMAFSAPLAVAAMSDSSNQVWLNSLWTQITVTPLANEEYYGNTLKMLSMIVVSGNWWAP